MMQWSCGFSYDIVTVRPSKLDYLFFIHGFPCGWEAIFHYSQVLGKVWKQGRSPAPADILVDI